MKQLLTTVLLFLFALSTTAQTDTRQITVTENIAYRTDVDAFFARHLKHSDPSISIEQRQNAQMDYQNIKKNPVVLADNTKSGHGGTYEQPNGGANARMVRAWLDWQLKDKAEHEKLFIGGDLTGYDDWTIKNKNFKK